MTHSGLAKVRSASGTAVSRFSVVTESSARAVAAGDPAGSSAWAASRALAAGLFVGLPSGLETNESEKRRIVSGLTTDSTSPLFCSVLAKSWNCRTPSAVKSSSTVWPLSSEITVSIASPPKRRWYTTLSL